MISTYDGKVHGGEYRHALKVQRPWKASLRMSYYLDSELSSLQG